MLADHYTKLIFLMMPIILGGIFNMVLVTLPWLSRLKTPMDRGLILGDGKRLFGDHKTWKGFLGMIVLTALFTALQGMAHDIFPSVRAIALLPFETVNAWLMGAVFGLGYVLAELPNSYIKRRIAIAPGKNGSGLVGKLFLFVDQADSVVGCLVAIALFYPLSWAEVGFLFLFGTGVHYALNILLYLVGLRKQAG